MTPEYKRYRTLRKEHIELMSQVNSAQENLGSIESKTTEILARKREEAAAKSQKAKEDAIQDATADKRVELADLEKGLGNLKTEYDKAMSEVTFDKYRGSSDVDSIMEDVKIHTEMLDEKITSIYGEETYNRLKDMVVAEESLSTDEILDIVDQYDIYSVKIDRGSGIRLDKVSTLVSGFAATVSEAQQNVDKRIIAVIIIALIVITAVVGYLVLPFYLLFVAIIMVVGFYNSYNVIDVIRVHKTILQNVDKVNEALNADVYNMMDEAKEQLTSEYNSDVARTQQSIEDCKAEIARITAEVSGKDFSVEVPTSSGLETQGAQLTMAIDNLKAEIAAKKRELDEAEAAARDSLVSLYNRLFTDKAEGHESIFPTDFVISLDSDAIKVKQFRLKEGPTMFICDNSDVLLQFFKLLIVQLRSTMEPSLISYRVYDKEGGGSDFIFFVPKAKNKDDLTPLYFRLLTTPDQFKATMVEDAEEFKSRNEIIKKEFGSIADYNAEMRKIASNPSDYRLNCIIGCDVDVTGNQEFQQLLLKGSEVGYLTWLFVTRQQLEKAGENVIETISKLVNIVKVSEDIISFEATSVLIKELSKKR